MKRLPAAVRDAATRERLLEIAAALFTERGFSHVTVRDLCKQAGANVAAVNYHFGEKLGLYMEVVNSAITAMRESTDLMMEPGARSAPKARLRHYVHAHLSSLAAYQGRAGWIHRLMIHEMNEPTPATMRISEEVIQPRLTYLSNVVAELLDCAPSDRRVQRCVMSVHVQCVFFGRLINTPRALRAMTIAAWKPETAVDIDAIVDYVTDFSLAGIRAMKVTKSF